MKKYIFVFLLFFLLSILFFTIQKNVAKKTIVLPTPVPAPQTTEKAWPPRLPSPLIQNKQKTVVFSGQTQPETRDEVLPIYAVTVQDQALRAAATSLVLKNGILETPKKIQTSGGPILLWASQGNYISLDPSRAALSYLRLGGTTRGQAPEKDSSDKAVRALLKDVSLGALEKNIAVESTESTAGRPTNAGASSERKLFLKYRIYVAGRFPLYMKASRSPVVVAAVGENNEVHSLSIVLTGLPGKIVSSSPVVSVGEAQKTLNGGGGVIFSYHEERAQTTEESSPPDFSGVIVTGSSLVYLIDSGSREARPYYVFRGSTTSAPPQTVEYLVSAVP